MKKYHNVSQIAFDDRYILLSVDGKSFKIDLERYSHKLAASPIHIKRHFEVSPSGYGIHWPEIDEDLSIDGLIGGSDGHLKERHPGSKKITAAIA